MMIVKEGISRNISAANLDAYKAKGYVVVDLPAKKTSPKKSPGRKPAGKG